jgi:signal peptidase I
MHPTIRHGDLITVEPVAPSNLKRGDIILYRLQNGFIAHRLVNIEERDGCGLTFFLRLPGAGSSPHRPLQLESQTVEHALPVAGSFEKGFFSAVFARKCTSCTRH